MIGQRPAWEGPHFQELVAHFALFEPEERSRLARLYQASGDEPRALAMSVCVSPERIEELIGSHELSEQAAELLLGLGLEHGAQVHVNGVGGNLHILMELRDLGLLAWETPVSEDEPIAVIFPGVFAAAFAHLEPPSRPSFFLLSGLLSTQEVEQLAKSHKVSSGPRLVMIMEIAQRFADERFMESLLPTLDDPDHVGPAITALELGGMCYWQDVFGFDDETSPPTLTGEAKVLPLMRDGALRSQQDMAAQLLANGLIFKFSLPDSEFPMLAVPEELWLNLWVLARDWLMGWFEHTYSEVRDGSTTQRDHDELWAASSPELFKHRMLWIVAVAHQRRRHPEGIDALATSLATQSSHDASMCKAWVELAVRLGLLVDPNALRVSDATADILEKPAREISRLLLSMWCVGHSTPRLERHLGLAVGLDEMWRQQARGLLVNVLSEQGELEMLSAWLESEGVEHDMTGMGYLRDLDEQFDELLLAEFSVANSIINYTRMLWLDVMSTLDEDQWYSQRKLGELLQFVLALSLFHHLAHLFEHPELSQYIPVQRPDYLTLPVHTGALLEWSDTLVEELLVPLGLATVVDGRVRVRARSLRIEGPPEMTHEFRERFMNTLLGLESFPLEGSTSGFSLRVLSAVREVSDVREGELALESWPVIMERLETHEVVGYDEAAGTLSLRRR